MLKGVFKGVTYICKGTKAGKRILQVVKSTKNTQELSVITEQVGGKVIDRVGKAGGIGVKLTGNGRKKIGTLIEFKDKIAREILKIRGGSASATKKGNVGDWWDKPLGEVANAAAVGNKGAETVMKLIKEAGKKAQKYGGK